MGYREQQHIEDQNQYDILHEKLLQLLISHHATPKLHLLMSMINYLRILWVIVHNFAPNINPYMVVPSMFGVFIAHGHKGLTHTPTSCLNLLVAGQGNRPPEIRGNPGWTMVSLGGIKHTKHRLHVYRIFDIENIEYINIDNIELINWNKSKFQKLLKIIILLCKTLGNLMIKFD